MWVMTSCISLIPFPVSQCFLEAVHFNSSKFKHSDDLWSIYHVQDTLLGSEGDTKHRSHDFSPTRVPEIKIQGTK